MFLTNKNDRRCGLSFLSFLFLTTAKAPQWNTKKGDNTAGGKKCSEQCDSNKVDQNNSFFFSKIEI